MTGPGHYKEAERLLSGVTKQPAELYTMDERHLFATTAQVHATLALAAATALGSMPGTHANHTPYGQQVTDWIEVTK